MAERVTLSYEDLLRAARPADPDPGAEADDGDVSDLFNTIRQFNLEVQQTMVQFRELLSMAAAIRGPGLPGAMGGAGLGGPAPAQPQAGPAPAGMDPKAQVLAGLQQIQAEVGDVTLLELVNVLAKQYGGLRLSDIISRIK